MESSQPFVTQLNVGDRITNIFYVEKPNVDAQFENEGGKTTSNIRCCINFRKTIFFKFENDCNHNAIQEFQKMVTNFQKEKLVWVQRACEKIVNIIYNVISESELPTVNLQTPDILSIKIMNPQFPTINLLEPNTKTCTFKRSQLFRHIDPQINEKIKSLTEIQLTCFQSLLNDIVANLSGTVSCSVILKAESTWTLYQAKIVHTLALETLIDAEKNQPSLFRENLLSYWRKGI